MKLLGLHINAGQTAAALIEGGEVRCAAAEERFNRVKQSRAFPREAIRFCLEEAKVKRMDELDGIAVSWNPAENMRHINLSGFTDWRRYDPEWLYIIPNQIMSMAGKGAFPGEVLKMEIGAGSKCPIYFVKHHHAHLAHAICHGSFEKGLAVIADEYGEFNSVTIATFRGNVFKIIKQIPYPNSLGVFYAALTEYLGFTPNSDEWKMMGASAYGKPSRFLGKLENLLAWNEREGELALDTRYIEHGNLKRAGYLNERIIKLVGIQPRNSEKEFSQKYYDLAAAAQCLFEKRLFQVVSHYAKKTKETNLVASGGCFMNSLANGKIIKNTPIRNLFIPYAPADNGGAIGSALYVWHYVLKKRRNLPAVHPSSFLGPDFSDFEIENILKSDKISYKKVRNIEAYTARMIAGGKTVGWFHGRMEFGERALGNRSILADPRNPDNKDKINAMVKYRESFRPFAPSIIEERVFDYFDIPRGVTVPYMEQVYPVRKDKMNKIPAVVHRDGTGRLQTVSKKANPVFHSLLREFEKITSIPVLLNTSFNTKDEPIVCSPQDAIRTFYACGLDALVLGHFVIEK